MDGLVESVADLARGAVVEVDGHCVIPMPLFGRSVDRPFKFRDATKKLRKQRLQRRWPNLDLPVEAYGGELPFEPVMVEHQLVDPTQRWSLLRRCNVDPTVHPVWRFKGGEQAALARWQAFKEKGLNGYARRRNNAADANGVSRMSAYIHYGMISPMKIAREAAEVGTKSAEKYLDELLVFESTRGTTFTQRPALRCSQPTEWARLSWRSTADDPPEPRATRCVNSSGRSTTRCGQRVNGPSSDTELHNNVRMTWGKGAHAVDGRC